MFQAEWEFFSVCQERDEAKGKTNKSVFLKPERACYNNRENLTFNETD